jgi:hypothetical protein
VVVAGATAIKLKERSPSAEVNDGVPEPPLENVGAVKSVLRATGLVPAESITVTVHCTVSEILIMVAEPLTAPVHLSVDDVVGRPYTASENGLFEIGSDDKDSEIKNAAVATLGAVKKKLKVAPPFVDVNIGVPVPGIPVVSYVGTAKSEEIPTEPPVASDTVIVQEINSLTRT